MLYIVIVSCWLFSHILHDDDDNGEIFGNLATWLNFVLVRYEIGQDTRRMLRVQARCVTIDVREILSLT